LRLRNNDQQNGTGKKGKKKVKYRMPEFTLL